MVMPNVTYVRPKSLKEAFDQLSAEGARVHAGGTDLLGCLRDDVFKAGKLVSLGQLKELRGITPMSDGGLRIGALTTLTEIANSKMIRETYSGLARAASEVASPQLRNQGTLGGNLCQKPRCWYYRGDFHCMRKGGDKCFAPRGENQFHCVFGGNMCYIVHPSDTAPVLVAFEASVRAAGPGGTRTIPSRNSTFLPEKTWKKRRCWSQTRFSRIFSCRRPDKGCEAHTARCVRANRGTSRWRG